MTPPRQKKPDGQHQLLLGAMAHQADPAVSPPSLPAPEPTGGDDPAEPPASHVPEDVAPAVCRAERPQSRNYRCEHDAWPWRCAVCHPELVGASACDVVGWVLEALDEMEAVALRAEDARRRGLLVLRELPAERDREAWVRRLCDEAEAAVKAGWSSVAPKGRDAYADPRLDAFHQVAADCPPRATLEHDAARVLAGLGLPLSQLRHDALQLRRQLAALLAEAEALEAEPTTTTGAEAPRDATHVR